MPNEKKAFINFTSNKCKWIAINYGEVTMITKAVMKYRQVPVDS